MATSIQFNKVTEGTGTTHLYQAKESKNLFYWLTSEVSGTLGTPPPTIDISDSWHKYNGIYVFTVCTLDATNNLWGEYCTKLAKEISTLAKNSAKKIVEPLLKLQSPDFNITSLEAAYKGIIWVDDKVNPNATGTQAKVSIDDGECLFLLLDGDWYITVNEVHVGFGNLKVPIPLSMKVIPASNPSTFSPTETNIHGFAITYWKGWISGADYPPDAEYQWYISLDPADCGSLQGQLALKNLNKDVYRDWTPGFRWDVPQSASTANATNVSQYYPLFTDGQEELVVYHIQWKPYDILNTSLFFSDRAMVVNKREPDAVPAYEANWPDATPLKPENLFAFAFDKMAFRSCLKTVYDNKTVLLIPQADARMVIGEYSTPGNPSCYYLMPAGGFEISIETTTQYTAGSPIKLLCGLAGTEFIQLSPRYEAYLGDILTFTANKHTNTTTNVASYISSYAGVIKNPANTTSPIYFTQPKAASLFQYEDNPLSAPLEHPILASTDVKNAILNVPETRFPMIPYGNVILSEGLSWVELTNFELTLIAKERKKLISAQVSPPPAIAADALLSTPKTTATPQGFIAAYSSGGLDWNSVTLALSEAGPFEFLPYNSDTYIPNKLRDTLQSNQLFMVASSQNNSVSGETNVLGTLNSQITINGWPFEAVVPQTVSDGDYNNVLLFKYSHGSLKDLVLDYTKWNQGDLFNNNNPAAVSLWLYNYISQAELAVQKANDGGSAAQASWLQNFVDIVNNPGWNGVMLLKVDVSVQSFPKELEGLIAGINLEKFYGHHIGFNINKLNHTGTDLEIASSSIFGLINYVATDSDSSSTNHQTTTNSSDPIYEFEVLNLQVLFENSKVRHFASKIQLTTNSWFNEKAVLNQSSGIQGFGIHAIEMDGHLEHHNGTNVYTFITKPAQVYQFNMQSQVLNYVEITQAKFTTLHISAPVPTPTPTNTSVKTITTHFIFSGFMNFKAQAPFDVFSFGDTEATQVNGLAFNNLAVDMDFELSTNNATDQSTVKDQTFTFDPSAISFDTSISSPREESMYNKFPLSLTNLAYSKGTSDKPNNHGYMAISVNTNTKFSALGEVWYGLEYNLNLGTPGALAAKMDFTASIITAWSPGGSSLQMDVGIKLPGSGGAKKLLSLENVIKLSIGQILFEAIPQTGDEAKLAYILTFFNIGLKFFSIHLPLHGAFNAALFGDPAGVNTPTSSLGWYAAYDNIPKKKLKKKST